MRVLTAGDLRLPGNTLPIFPAVFRAIFCGVATNAPPGAMGRQVVSENETALGAGQQATAFSTGRLASGNRFFGLDLHQFVSAAQFGQQNGVAWVTGMAAPLA